MNEFKTSIPLKSLVSLVGHLTGGYEDPDHPLPPGPWSPVIREALKRVRWNLGPSPEPWRQVMLNPQPLPPRLAFAVALGQSVVDHLTTLQEFGLALPTASQESIKSYSSGYLKRFIDDCGNGIIVIHIPKHGPFPPSDDEPKPINPEELIVLGAQLALASAIHPELEGGAMQLIELGFNRM